MSVIRRKGIEQRSNGVTLHEAYLTTVEASPIISQYARDDRHWVNCDKLGGEDLRVLQAARVMVQRIRESD